MFKKFIMVLLCGAMALMADDLQSIQGDLRQRIDAITAHLSDKTLTQADKN